MNSYRATVTATFIQSDVTFTTYVKGRSAQEAKRELEREGYNVVQMWARDLSACNGPQERTDAEGYANAYEARA